MSWKLSKQKKYSRHGSTVVILCLAILILPSVVAETMSAQHDRKHVQPSIPSANRYQQGKVFLEHADRLVMDDKVSIEYQKLEGNVRFRKGDMYMWCDSAYFYDGTGSINAFGNVRMEQGDTLFVYADELDYNGQTDLATLYSDQGKKVKLINRDVKLETDIFNYDLAIDLGYYEVGGVLTDRQNRLESLQGEYSPSTKEANFYIDVALSGISDTDSLRMYTDTLTYSTATHIAEIVCPTKIISKDGEIYTSSGTYNTDSAQADLYNRSLVVTNNGNTLTGDTLFYDRQKGYGKAFGNMILTDSVRQSALLGDYGFYNELTDSAFVTGRALAKEYSREDTLYLHGDTIQSYMLKTDSSHVMNVYHKVRFWRVDVQGVCDSLSFHENDSILYMYRHPIIWSGVRQIFGNQINIHFNDSTVDWALLPDFGFMAEHVDEEFYNQLSGSEMKAYFANNEITRLDVNGNVVATYLPEENDSTINKIGNAVGSFLRANFSGRSIERMVLWPEPDNTLTPLYLAKKSLYYQPKFKWYEPIRPKDKEDIFIVPKEMDDLLKEPDPSERRRLTR